MSKMTIQIDKKNYEWIRQRCKTQEDIDKLVNKAILLWLIEEAKLKYQCLRCGNKWTPRTENPKQCPKCKSPYWNKPKKRE